MNQSFVPASATDAAPQGPAKLYRSMNLLGLESLFHVLYSLEIVLTITGTCLLILALRYRRKSKIHVNIQRIFANAELHLALLSPVRFFSIALVVSSSGQDYPAAVVYAYRVITIIRTYYMVVSGLTLPAAALERVFSTVCVKDYETVRRTYLSWMLIATTNAVSLALSVSLNCHLYGIGLPLIIIGTTNICGLAAFIWSSRRNITYYHASLVTRSSKAYTSYSLSERFQTMENIRVSRLLKNLYLTVWIANAICFCLILVPVLSRDELVAILSSQVFNIGVTIFPNVVGIVNLRQSQHFRTDVRRFLRKFSRRHRCSTQEPPQDASLRNVFGTKLMHTTAEETNLYFQQLQQAWSVKETTAPRKRM